MPAHATPSRSFSGEGNAEAGVSPESVDYVMCTHLHVDHCGWNMRLLDGRWVPTFRGGMVKPTGVSPSTNRTSSNLVRCRIETVCKPLTLQTLRSAGLVYFVA